MDSDFAQRVGQRITLRRKSLNMSQVELSRRANITQAAIHQIEAGKRVPRVPTAMMLADALVTSLDYIVGRSDSPSVAQYVSDPAQDLYRKYLALSMREQQLIRMNMEFLFSDPLLTKR